MLQLNQPREGRVQPGLGSLRPRRPASETPAGGEAHARGAAAVEDAAAKVGGSRRARPDGCPRGQPHQSERRQAVRPPRYNHLHLGGPVRARQTRKQLNSSQNAIPAASSRSPQRWQRPRRRRFSPHARSRYSPLATGAACLAITSPVERAAEAQRHRPRSRFATTPPITSGSLRKPSPSRSAQRTRLQLRSRAQQGFGSCKPELATRPRLRDRISLHKVRKPAEVDRLRNQLLNSL